MSRASVLPIAQFTCVVLAAIAIPALVLRSSTIEQALRLKDPKPAKPTRLMRASGGVQDAASGQAILRKTRPDWVLIGNSVLNCRVENQYLGDLSQHGVYKLSFSGTKSAMWFLMLKHIVVESGVKPKCVTIFFRDRDLTWPELNMHHNGDMVDRMKGREQPEWDLVMGDYEAAINGPMTLMARNISSGVDTLFPAAKFREWARTKLQKSAFKLSAFGSEMSHTDRRAELNALFSLDHLRRRPNGPPQLDDNERAIMDDRKELEVEPLAFDPSPTASFLPHMVALARQDGFKLHFHRIKINPEVAPAGSESERTLPAYLDALQAWLASNGCLYSDESSVQALTNDMYVDDVHIRADTQNQQAYMGHFWSHVRPTIADVMGAEARTP